MDGCVYIGISRDGMIARADGSIDAILMGRNTFDSIPGVDQLEVSPYGETPVFVLTSRPLDVPDVFSGLASPIAGTPAEVAAQFD